MVIDKEKQKEEVFLYKPYTISSEPRRPTIPKPILLKEQVNNLEKVLKTLQSSTNIISFLPPAHYKTIQQDGEKNIQYWKEITTEFIKQKHNLHTSH